MSGVRRWVFLKRIGWPWAALFFLLACILVINALWLKIDHRPPRWDESSNLRFAERAHHLISRGKILQALHTEGALRPNAVPFLSGLSFYLVGHSTKLAVWLLNAVALVAISIALLGLGSRLFSPAVGLLAGVIFNTYPSVALWSRYYNLDLPLTAFVTLTIWLLVLVASQDFKNARLAWLLGLVMTVGGCSKHLYFILMAASLFGAFVMSFAGFGFRWREALKQGRSFYGACLVALAVSFLYHGILNHESFVDGFLRSFFTSKSVLNQSGYVPPKMGEKISSFYLFQLGGSRLHLVLLGIGSFMLLPRLSRGLVLALLLPLWSFIFLVFLLQVTMPYYFMPAMPILALVSVAWFFEKKTWEEMKIREKGVKVLKILTAVGLSAALLTAHLERSLNTRSWACFAREAPSVLRASGRMMQNPFSETPYWNTSYVDGNRAFLPYPHYWPVDEMLSDVEKVIRSRPVPMTYRLCYFTNYEWMTGDYFSYKIWQRGLQDHLTYVIPIPVPEDQDPVAKFFADDYDFAVLKTGRVLKNDFYGIPWADQGQAFVDRLTAGDYQLMREHHFDLIGRYPLPDGSEATVWVSERKRNRYSLLDAFRWAKTTIHKKGTYAVTAYTIGNESRRVLYHHPVQRPKVSEVSWLLDTVPPGTRLRFGIALNPETWRPDRGDGVVFEVAILAGGARRTVFRREIDPKQKSEDRKWHDADLDLGEFAGQKISLVLRTEPGSLNDNAWDHALWSGLDMITEKESGG